MMAALRHTPLTFVRMFCLTLVVTMTMAQKLRDVDTLINTCIDSKHHKSAPGPEGSLFTTCHQWKNRSCCTEDTTRLIQESSPYNFNYDHCSRVKSMSSECKRHFMLDHCFYECSPNVGPWVVSENRLWRRERYWGVPLCAIDCELWFTACADDVTCTDNWTNNFRWLNMTGDCPTRGSCLTNYCPVNSTCQTFKKIYRTARNFCEKVWDNAWKYAEPTTPCMHLQFNQSAINPNDAVALHYAQIIAGSQMHSCNLVWFSIQLAVWAFINRILTVAS
nr:folate receptor beta-like [Procambarus clarkii]